MTVGQRDISFDRRAHHRPGNFQIRVGPRGERILLRAIRILSARKSRSMLASVSLGENDPATEGERLAGEDCPEIFPGSRRCREKSAGLESAQRRQCRVSKARGINGDVATAGEGRARNRSANGDIERHVAVKLFNRRNELPQKIH